MKKIILVSMLLGLAAVAHVRLVKTFHVDRDTVVYGSIHFPGYGDVPSSRVCLTNNGQTLTAKVGIHNENVCVDSHVDRSDSTHPVTVCDRYETVRHEARVLETPVTTKTEGCVKSHVDRSDSTHPVTVCDRRGEMTYTQDLTYWVYKYHSWDYRHESTPDTSLHRIQACK